MARQKRSNVQIIVQNINNRPLSSAEVTLRSLETDATHTLEFDKQSKTYQATDLLSGRYLLEVKSNNLESQTREVQFAETNQTETVILGKEGLPSYYRGRMKVPFDPPRNLLGLTIQPGTSDEQEEALNAFAQELGLTVEEVGAPILADNVRVFRYPPGTSETERLAIQRQITNHPAVRLAGPVIHLTDEQVTYLTSEWIIRFKSEVTEQVVASLSDRLGLRVIRKIPYAGNAYLLRSQGAISFSELQVAEDLLESDLVEYVEPNLVITTVDFQVNPADFLYGQQWHIPLIDLPEAWQALRDQNPPGVTPGDPGDLTFGSEDTIIAIMDRGLESTTAGGVTTSDHPDFDGTVTGGANKVYQFFDFALMQANNDNPPNDHGMGCAGVATALANNSSTVAGEVEGVAGAAPNCRVMGLIRPAGGTVQQYADAYIWIAGFDPGWVADGVNYPAGTVFPAVPSPGADIISNSFLMPTGGLMNDTFDFLATYGRSGKGIVNFVAAGNGNINTAIENPMAAHGKALAIAASTDGDVKAGYSSWGNAIEVCAPSSGGAQGISTCDLMGGGNIAGNSGGGLNYRNNFGGTSSATPLVAGVAALMLSVEPSLTWIQVREILRTTAQRIDTANTNPVGQWVDNDGDGIDEFSQWYGYGRIDANAAVNAVIDLTTATDVVVRDNLTDTGVVPSTGWHAHSPDIWTRSMDDPIPVLGYNSNPPHQNPKRGQDNYVYLRVKNVGTAASNEVYLRALITHFPGFEFRYPEEWLPSSPPSSPVPSPLLPGSYLIGEELIDNLAPGVDIIVKMIWDEALVPPNEVVVDGMTVKWHPCLLADVTPHDGPAPAGATFDVKRDNNLAHRNITVDDPDLFDDLFAVGIVAGTSDQVGTDALIIDRSLLPVSYRVFVRVADEQHMEAWLQLVETGGIKPAEVLPGSPGVVIDEDDWPRRPDPPGECQITLLEATRIGIKCCDGNAVIIHTPAKTRIEHICDPRLNRRPRVSVGTYQGKKVVYFDGGSQAIELPLRLPAGKYVPVVLGLDRPSERYGGGLLKATQLKGSGELSPGYTIEG
jgi:subtilisin family serine protease